MTFARLEAAGVQEWLAGLREELVSKTYRPQPVRRVMLPKPGAGKGRSALDDPTLRQEDETLGVLVCPLDDREPYAARRERRTGGCIAGIMRQFLRRRTFRRRRRDNPRPR